MRRRSSNSASAEISIQRLGGRRVHSRLLVVGQKEGDAVFGQRLGVAGSLVVPGLEGLVIQKVGSPERLFEVPLGVIASQVMTAWADLGSFPA